MTDIAFLVFSTSGSESRKYRFLYTRQFLPFGTHQFCKLTCCQETCASGRPRARNVKCGEADHGPNSALGFCFLNLPLHSIVKNMYGERAFFGTPLSFLLLVFRSCACENDLHKMSRQPPPRVKCEEKCVSSSFVRRGGGEGVKAHEVHERALEWKWSRTFTWVVSLGILWDR